MTEPSPQRPVPGPPRLAPAPTPPSDPVPAPADQERLAADRFADLYQHPVAEHVAIFEAEHGRLQRELGTIDQL